MSTGPSQPQPPPRRRRRREHPALYALATLLALLLQAAFVGLLALLAHLQPPAPPHSKPSAVALRPMSAQDWEKNRGPLSNTPSTARAPVPKKKDEKKPEKKPEGQVVDVAQGNRQQAPDAKYLAESDNKVDKETRAREQTANYKKAAPRTTARTAREGNGVSEEQAGHVAGNGGRGVDDRPLSEGGKKSAFELPDARRKQEIAMRQDNTRGPGVEVSNRDESDEVVGNAKRLKIQEGSGDGDEGSEGRLGSAGLAKLMPSQAVMDQIVGGAPNDHLKNVEEGDGTFLNTREWKYASFFNRIKQSVGTHWNPNTALMRRDPTGATFAGRDRYTMVHVTLDEQGKVADITIEKSCGLDFLDLEAVESFRRAQPFPNPPAGLLEDDAKVRFSFGFFMDMGGGPRMRLFRQPN